MATGASLLILRELSPHGQFLERVDRLGIDRRLAQRFMSAALKFGKSGDSPLLGAAGNVSKLLELTVLDDAEIALLASGESARGITLDAIEGMGFRELREALRDAQADLQVANEARGKQQAKLDKLERERKAFAKLPPDDVLKKLLDEANTVMLDARGCIHGQLRAAVLGIQNHAESHDGNRSAHDTLLAGLVSQLITALKDLQAEALLPDVSNAADTALLSEVAQWDKSK